MRSLANAVGLVLLSVITAGCTAAEVTDFRARQVSPCPGEFLGAVDVGSNGTVLRGQYAGSDCGGAVTASSEAIRQQ